MIARAAFWRGHFSIRSRLVAGQYCQPVPHEGNNSAVLPHCILKHKDVATSGRRAKESSHEQHGNAAEAEHARRGAAQIKYFVWLAHRLAACPPTLTCVAAVHS